MLRLVHSQCLIKVINSLYFKSAPKHWLTQLVHQSNNFAAVVLAPHKHKVNVTLHVVKPHRPITCIHAQQLKAIFDRWSNCVDFSKKTVNKQSARGALQLVVHSQLALEQLVIRVVVLPATIQSPLHAVGLVNEFNGHA